MTKPDPQALRNVLKSALQRVATAAREDTGSPAKRRQAAQLAPTETAAPEGYECKGSRRMSDKPDDDRSKLIDIHSEARLLAILRIELCKIGVKRFAVLTEERGLLITISDAAWPWDGSFLLLLIDPIDSTDLFLMRFGGAIAITALWVRAGDAVATVLAAVVLDLLSGETFWADVSTDGASVDCPVSDGQWATEALVPGPSASWPAITVSTYAAKIPRLLRLLEKTGFLETLDMATARLVSHHGGSLPLCRVAAGDIAAALEFGKGYKCIDYVPGAYIAHKAGAGVHISDQPCGPERLDIALGATLDERLIETLTRRRRFVVAANQSVAAKLIDAFGI